MPNAERRMNSGECAACLRHSLIRGPPPPALNNIAHFRATKARADKT
jgi:hypothetical protein